MALQNKSAFPEPANQHSKKKKKKKFQAGIQISCQHLKTKIFLHANPSSHILIEKSANLV